MNDPSDSSEPTPNTSLEACTTVQWKKQCYSMPLPMMKYMFENASAIVYYRFYQTCKILNAHIESKYSPQVDVFEAGKLSNSASFLSFEAGKEIRMRGTNEIYQELHAAKPLWIRRRLMLYGLGSVKTAKFLSKLNLRTVKEIYLLHTAISITEYEKLMIPSIEIMYGNVCAAADDFDIIDFTLSNLPNLRVFKLPWCPTKTTFEALTKITRLKKLEKATIYDFPSTSDAEQHLIPFVNEHMLPGSTLFIEFRLLVNYAAKNRILNLADDFNMNSATKILTR